MPFQLAIAEYFAQARNFKTEQDLSALAARLNGAEANIAEAIRVNNEKPLARMVNRLREGAELAPEELKQLRAWIVGDEAEVQQLEQDWQHHIKRLAQIETSLLPYEQTPCPATELPQLQRLLHEASSVSWKLIQLLEHLQRVEYFDNIISSGLSQNNRLVYANILEKRLVTPIEEIRDEIKRKKEFADRINTMSGGEVSYMASFYRFGDPD